MQDSEVWHYMFYFHFGIIVKGGEELYDYREKNCMIDREKIYSQLPAEDMETQLKENTW